MLNEEAARRYLGDQNPIGRTIAINGDRTVVGIVSNVRLGGPESDIRPEAYVPYAQSTQVGGELVERTAGDPAPIADAVRSAVWASYPDIAIDEVTTMETLLGRLIAQRQFNMLLVGLFGVLAMVIAGAGIYGVMAYIVTQRTQEIGVRMALGARPAGVLLTVLRRAAAFLVLGLAAGLAGAWALASSILFQVEPRDVTVFASTGVLLFVVGIVAALVPARRASRVRSAGRPEKLSRVEFHQNCNRPAAGPRPCASCSWRNGWATSSCFKGHPRWSDRPITVLVKFDPASFHGWA